MYLYEEKAVFFILLMEMIITVVFLAMQVKGYSKLIQECEKGERDNLVIRNIKEGKINVNSVDNFVNKYVSNFKFCGLKLYTIKRICGQLLNFVFITWCMVSIYGVYLEVSIKDVLWTTMLGILVVGVVFSIGYSVDNSKYEYIAMVNLKNNLEEYIYFNDDNYKIIYDSARNEITEIEYISNDQNDYNNSEYNVNDVYYTEEESEDMIRLVYEDLMESAEENISQENKKNLKKEAKRETKKDQKLDPVARREKLKQSVFASGDEKRSDRKERSMQNIESSIIVASNGVSKSVNKGRKVVELNNDNLGYLADY